MSSDKCLCSYKDTCIHMCGSSVSTRLMIHASYACMRMDVSKIRSSRQAYRRGTARSFVLFLLFYRLVLLFVLLLRSLSRACSVGIRTVEKKIRQRIVRVRKRYMAQRIEAGLPPYVWGGPYPMYSKKRSLFIRGDMYRRMLIYSFVSLLSFLFAKSDLDDFSS